MKEAFCFILGIFLFSSCSNTEKKLKSQGVDYWGESHAGDTTTIQTAWSVYFEGKDTMTYSTNYYTNGKLKSKVVYKGEGLWNIEFVLDTLGNHKPFGEFKDGTGCVTQYSFEDGNPASKGCYKNGNKEGWWLTYHYTGVISDSSLYKNGYDQRNRGDSALEGLLDLFGEMKNNLYE